MKQKSIHLTNSAVELINNGHKIKLDYNFFGIGAVNVTIII